MEALTLSRNILMSKNNYVCIEELSKIVNTNRTFYSQQVSENEQSILLHNIKSLNVEQYNISDFINKHSGMTIKLIQNKEIKKFNNNNIDERLFNKMILSIECNNRKKISEIYSKDILQTLQNIDFFYNNAFNEKPEDVETINLNYSNIPYLKFNTEATGYLFHEIIGHTLEEDNYKYTDNYIKKSKIRIPDWLLVSHDNGPYPDSLNIGKYDDNGNTYDDSVLIQDGRICNYIGKGNYRSATFYDLPIPRMRTITVKNKSFQEEPDIKEFLLIKKISAGLANPITGLVNILCENIFYIKNNKTFYTNKKLFIAGYLKDFLENLIFLDSNNTYKTGKCFKKGQIVHVGLNGPNSIFLNRGLSLCAK